MARTRIQEAVEASPFNIFNIVAIVVILVLGFYLYKKFLDKKPGFKFPLVQPEATSAKSEPAAAPVPEPEADEVPDSKED